MSHRSSIFHLVLGGMLILTWGQAGRITPGHHRLEYQVDRVRLQHECGCEDPATVVRLGVALSNSPTMSIQSRY